MDHFEIVKDDITRLSVDAIVNAANSSLLGGGGVDGAIHRAAGPQLLAACRELRGCKTGEAKITPGFKLPAKWVIHTVGPIWHNGKQGEDDLLANCYRNSLALVVQHGLKTVAFPAISTGVYSFPIDRAAQIAVREISQFLQMNQTVDKVIAVCFDNKNYASYQQAISGRI
ncbi:MAG: O-acetyl-ADP-ribose deacetylase [Aggregatilineales bacterium]